VVEREVEEKGKRREERDEWNFAKLKGGKRT
jgi:hypothetical protein